MTKRLFILSQILVFSLLSICAQDPNDWRTYYQAANGEKGEALKTALFNIIKLSSPAPISYDGLIESYKETDTRSDGKVRDWYSNATNFTHVIDKAGNYSKEGDVYNREHLIPQSWFNKAAPMRSDIVHVVPTDGYVNNRRGDLPLAEVGSATYTSINGYSKLGSCKTTGYSGKVFEPNDEVKGDIARIYFYMATCYQDKITGWSGEVITGTAYQPYAEWYFNMLMRWSKLDPIDEVEIARNNAVKKEQGNRNPFVDYPGLEEYIWGDKKNETFYYDNYNGNENYVASPTFSPATGKTFTESLVITLACSTTGATIRYTTDGSTPNQQSALYSAPISISETTTIKAIAYYDDNASSVATATYTKKESAQPVEGSGTFIFNTDEGLEALGITKPGASAGTNISGMQLTSGDITLTSTDGTTETRVWNSSGNTDLRIYNGGSLTFSSETPIVKIIFYPAVSLQGLTNGQWTGSSKTITFTASATAKIQTITVTTQSEGKEDVTMAFSAAEASAQIGQPFTAPTLTVAPSGLAVSYSSSNESVATIDASGAVTLVGEGETTITATFSGNDNYNPASASYTLSVTKEQPSPDGEPLLYESFSGYTNETDGSANISPNDEKLDYKNWEAFTNVYFGANGCGKMSSSKNNGSMHTGAIQLSGKGTLTFKLKKYNNEVGKLSISVEGATAAESTTFTAPADWTDYTVNLTEATGTVTLTFTATKRLYIDEIKLVKEEETEEPETETISISSAGYATLYYGDKNLEVPAGVKAYTYSVVGGELIVNNTYEADDIIPAGTGVVLEASAGDYSFTVSEEGGLSDDGNMLRGSDEAEEVSDANYTYYILSDGTKGIGFYYGKKDGKDSPHAISNAAHKAYLAVPNEQTGAKTGFAFSMLADAISTAVISEQPAPVYNLQGQRVSNAQLKPGIYVSNGRKFIVR